MKRIPRTLVTVALGATMFPAVANAQDRKTEKPATTAAVTVLPESFLKAFPEYDRFRDPAYLRLVAGDGLRSADPQAIFQRMAAATKAGEAYKALYLARAFTKAKPDLPAGWTNRAQLAAALGFDAEAEASRANAGKDARPIPPSVLPGAIKVRPTTLSDWAAALALVADDVAAKESPATVVAVRDDLSGYEVASAEEVQSAGRGAWATSKPVQVEHVLTNLFVMTQATPMDKKSMRGGMFALGAVAFAGSAYATTIGATDAARSFSEMYGNTMGKAFEVASELKGGSFHAVTYANGSQNRIEKQPKTSGKYEAVGTPLPMLWASGGSADLTFHAQWTNGDSSKSEAMRIDGKTKKAEWKKHNVPVLTYPRVHQLCANARLCSPKLTVLELLLTAEDVAALAPGAETRLPETARWKAMYSSRQPMSVVGAGDTFAGFDQKGVIYVTKQRPTEWLTAAARATKSGT